jgi:hypothetical protein
MNAGEPAYPSVLVTPPRAERVAQCPPAPSKPAFKIDFSKMPQKDKTPAFVFPKSTEQQLAEALAENQQFREAINRMVETHNAQRDEIDRLKKELARVKKSPLRVVNVGVERDKKEMEAALKQKDVENAALKEAHANYKKELYAKINGYAESTGEVWVATISWRRFVKNATMDEELKDKLISMIAGKAEDLAKTHGSLAGFAHRLKREISE